MVRLTRAGGHVTKAHRKKRSADEVDVEAPWDQNERAFVLESLPTLKVEPMTKVILQCLLLKTDSQQRGGRKGRKQSSRIEIEDMSELLRADPISFEACSGPPVALFCRLSGSIDKYQEIPEPCGDEGYVTVGTEWGPIGNLIIGDLLANECSVEAELLVEILSVEDMNDSSSRGGRARGDRAGGGSVRGGRELPRFRRNARAAAKSQDTIHFSSGHELPKYVFDDGPSGRYVMRVSLAAGLSDDSSEQSSSLTSSPFTFTSREDAKQQNDDQKERAKERTKETNRVTTDKKAAEKNLVTAEDKLNDANNDAAQFQSELEILEEKHDELRHAAKATEKRLDNRPSDDNQAAASQHIASGEWHDDKRTVSEARKAGSKVVGANGRLKKPNGVLRLCDLFGVESYHIARYVRERRREREMDGPISVSVLMVVGDVLA